MLHAAGAVLGVVSTIFHCAMSKVAFDFVHLPHNYHLTTSRPCQSLFCACIASQAYDTLDITRT